MITIFSGTNRRNSRTLPVAKQFSYLFEKYTDEQVRLFSLHNLPLDFIHNGMYAESGQHDRISEIQDQYLIPAEKFFFVFPEYNGGMPGILKFFIDACSVREYKPSFKNKKAAMAGISTGRAGNLRGMDHLTDVLNHVGTIVLPNRLPISKVDQLVDKEGMVSDEETLKSMERQILEFLEF